MFGFFTREPIVGHRELRHHHVLQYQESTSTLLLYDDFSLDVPHPRASLFGAHSPFQGEPSARLEKYQHPQWARTAG